MKKFFFYKETIMVPTFLYDVRVVVTNDFKKAAAKLKVPLSEQGCKCHAVAIHAVSAGESTIFFPPDVGVGTVAHEAWHVVRRMLTSVEAELDNEVVAYHLGYLVRNCHHILKAAKKRKKKK